MEGVNYADKSGRRRKNKQLLCIGRPQDGDPDKRMGEGMTYTDADRSTVLRSTLRQLIGGAGSKQ